MFHTKTNAALLSIISNSLLILLKVGAGIITGSVSVLAEALHSGIDLLAAVIAFFSIRIANRPADEEHPFGHGKAENISGTVEAALIGVAAAFIVYEAMKRILAGAQVEAVYLGIGAMVVSIVVNSLVSRHLMRVARATESLALEADAQHLATDVYTSLGVLVGLAIVRLSGLVIIDPIVALGVAVLILKVAYDVTKRSFGGLVDIRLPEAEEAIIRASIIEHYGELVGFHKLRTRKSGSERFIDLHLVMAKDIHIEGAHQLCDHLEADIERKFPRTSVTIHIEPSE